MSSRATVAARCSTPTGRWSDGEVVGMTVAASSGFDVTGYVIPIGRVLRVVDTVLTG